VSFLSIIWNIWLELSPWMLLGAFIAGLMHVLVPSGWIQRQLTGRMGVWKAVIIGVPLPLCSCGVIPVGLGLRRNGAGNGATVGFLISTPQTGIDSILVSASFLGWPFAVLKVVAALVTGLVGGYLADSGPTAEVVTSEPEKPDCCHGPGIMAVFSHGMQLIRSIWRWLVVGVLISASITYFAPTEFISHQPVFHGLAALLLTLLISLPLYVCATASVPIAAALVASGFPPGAALVFLMAGPATNVATLGAIYKTLGRRPLLVYLTTIIAGSLIAGMAFNSLIDVADVVVAAHSHATAWWATLGGAVLAIIVLWLAVQEFVAYVKRMRGNEPPDPNNAVFVELGAKPKD
jgi:uncharacterized membrane protein YraQ (UPF0718 family)